MIPPGPTRRTLLASLLAAGAIPGAIPLAWAAPQMALIMAGPPKGPLQRWANLLAAGLGNGLDAAHGVRVVPVGGLDGVTGANQLALQTDPDGTAAALLPGATLRAWLAGDSRVHFDAARWVPLFALLAPAVLVTSLPDQALRRGNQVRVALRRVAGADLAAALALAVLGLQVRPVMVDSTDAARRVLLNGGADVALLRGAAVPDRLAALPSPLRALCSLGAVDGAGHAVRDPALPNLPAFTEVALSLRGHPATGPLAEAAAASAAAARIEACMVLPLLTPAAKVALWRGAVTQASETPALHDAAAAATLAVAPPPQAVAAINAAAAPPGAQLALRRFLAMNLHWSPS